MHLINEKKTQASSKIKLRKNTDCHYVIKQLMSFSAFSGIKFLIKF